MVLDVGEISYSDNEIFSGLESLLPLPEDDVGVYSFVLLSLLGNSGSC